MAKTLQSIDLTSCITKTRSGVNKGTRYFTRTETIRNVRLKNERKEKRGAAIDILAEAKRKARDEVDRKAAMLEAIKAKREAGVSVKCPIKEGKDGKLFVQPREGGRFGKRLVVFGSH